MLTNRLDKIEDKILDLRSFARNNLDRKGLLINRARFARRRHEWFAFTRRWPSLPNLFDIAFAIIGLDLTARDPPRSVSSSGSIGSEDCCELIA